MSANSKRRRHLKWLKKKEAEKEATRRESAAEQGVDLAGYQDLSVNLHLNNPPRPATAPDIYVSPEGNDETGDGSVDRPFRTTQRAVSSNIAEVGQSVIHVAGGWIAPGSYESVPVTRVVETVQTARLRPLHQPLYDTATLDANTENYYTWDVNLARIFDLIKGLGIKRNEVSKFIEELIIAEKDRRNPPKSEVIVPAIRHLDLED